MSLKSWPLFTNMLRNSKKRKGDQLVATLQKYITLLHQLVA